jgi:HSP20 family protein
MNFIPWRNKRKTGELSALDDLRHEVDRLFDSFMSLGRDPLEFFGGAQWQPSLDVSENQDEITVHAEVPGVDPQDLDVTVTGNRLTIAGEKRDERQQTSHGVHASERRYGSFRRSIELSSAVDPDAIHAECVQGVLTLKLKKMQAAKGRRIAVNQT